MLYNWKDDYSSNETMNTNIKEVNEHINNLENEVARFRETLEFIAKATATHDSTAYYRTLAQAALAPASEEHPE